MLYNCLSAAKIFHQMKTWRTAINGTNNRERNFLSSRPLKLVTALFLSRASDNIAKRKKKTQRQTRKTFAFHLFALHFAQLKLFFQVSISGCFFPFSMSPSHSHVHIACTTFYDTRATQNNKLLIIIVTRKPTILLTDSITTDYYYDSVSRYH